ncbi:ribosome-binding factor A [[Clostridium] methylpentosum DSM 5476]|jgi:ribosome-binding factor A|uniref:Ribosome-binding factor A n=1 Tax=[Clostridium] methylpentosum DSM 5476 TaxID=537013 RepID=C0EAK4_9FIRM|nr:ribosome-binding factor A [[Clostridium] methylpentosum DSM 5476]MDY3988298.1 30S ribosome-binding factor RbfA [Massilioclostridium sp.]
MGGYKVARLAEDIKRELSVLVRDLKDPRIKGKMLSFVRVEVTNDQSFAKVYVSSMEGMEAAKEAVEGLKSASGFVKRELSNTLHMRKCPDIKFIPDDSIEYSAHLNKLLLDIETE